MSQNVIFGQEMINFQMNGPKWARDQMNGPNGPEPRAQMIPLEWAQMGPGPGPNE